jgi:hypothetical protein
MKYKEINIIQGDGIIATENLDHKFYKNVQLKISDDETGTLNLMYFLIDYILKNQPIIRDNHTISYGLWLLKFILVDDRFHIYELDEHFENWIEGASRAIYYLELQRSVCKEEKAQLNVPLFTQKIALSKGVLEGNLVQGIRYPSEGNMCGWYLSTSEYDRNIKNMTVVDLPIFVVKRSDLIQFLGLPCGFVFEVFDNNSCQIWTIPEHTQNNSGN